MAEALVGVLIEQLASIAIERAKEELSLVKNVGSDVKKLTCNLEEIKAVLSDAEKKQLTENSVKLWVEKLKEASFEMDNVLDEWSTAILKLKIQKEAAEQDFADHHSKASKKVCFPSIFSCCRAKVNRLALRHDIAHKIKDLNETLAEIASQKNQFNLNTIITEKALERPKTNSFVDETEVEGREVDKEILVRKLCENSSTQLDKGLHIIPIVGMGGIGKTTLAQLAYKDEKVKAHFDLRIWVCVSEPFDGIKVAKAIIESVEENSPNINELESLLKRVVKCIEGKRFLLILDDVWTKDSKEWNPFKEPLKCGSIGSRVIVTTRKEEVAIMMGVRRHMITLEKLSEEHCWLVFKKMAFLDRSEEECKDLEGIGRQIANKCKGLPLAAKSLGSLMCFKKSKNQWENVLRSEMWRLEKETFAPFLLSYYDLSAKERRCFSYCSIFPKDHRIERDRLIEMWMSQKYFGDATSQEEEGRECFDNLVMRSFFQNFERDERDGSIKYCKMHDIVHDFAQSVTENECLALQVNDVDKRILKLSSAKTRHLTIVVESNAEFPTLDFTEMDKRRVHSLFIVNDTPIRSIDCSMLLHLTCLRSLTLSSCDIKEFPASVGGLIHLRYLDLSHNYEMEELPEALCELCNLQTLYLLDCRSLRRLPHGVGKLVSLRHLCFGVDYFNELAAFPKGFGKLKSLRSLDTLVLAEDKAEYFCFEDLKMLTNLQLRGTFGISECRNLKSKEEAEKVDLKNTGRYVDRLRLDFGWLREETETWEEDSAILEGLEPQKEVLQLEITQYSATTLCPTWLSFLTNLREFRLVYCNNLMVLPSLGKLTSLDSITLWEIKSLKKVGPEFLGITEPSSTIFPRLKKLEFYSLPSFEKWEGNAVKDGIRITPCLETLRIWNCHRLSVLPGFLETTTSLKELSIYSSKIIEEQCRERTGSEWAKISHVPNIRLNFNEYVRKDGIWMDEHNDQSE